MNIFKNMLDGIVGDIGRTRRVDEARSIEPVAVRLVPQVPLRDNQGPRSWFGGAPAMPEHVDWPMVDGHPANFLCQICCEDLPADLWGGRGPRTGWLVFFAEPSGYGMNAIHLDKLGPWRPAPASFVPEGWIGSKRSPRPPLTFVEAWPRWPVDVLPVRPGDPDPRRGGRSEAMFADYKRGYDLADPSRRPFDRATTLAMLQLAEARIVGRLEADWISSARQKLERAETMPETVEPVVRPGGIKVAPDSPAKLRDRIELLEAHYRSLEAALPRFREMAATIRAGATDAPLAASDIATLMTGLHQIEITDPEGSDLPLTMHNGLESLWAAEFEPLLFDRARHAYCASPGSLPQEMRDRLEAIWSDLAAHEMAGMGHAPLRYASDFDPETEVTLLELPSSELIGWRFGDIDNLIVTIDKSDLAAKRFGKLKVQCSN
jgi:hypothetical protein